MELLLYLFDFAFGLYSFDTYGNAFQILIICTIKHNIVTF